jgi:hypothetical protein
VSQAFPRRAHHGELRLQPAALALFVALGLLGILHHEMWRDELEIWLIARDSDSLRHLLHNMRTEGHPALWYLLVYAVSRLSSDPISMQLLHLAIGCCSVGLILRYAPFSDVSHAASALAQQHGESVVMILSISPDAFEKAWPTFLESSDVYMRLAAGFDGAIVGDENYVVVWVDRMGNAR